MSRDELFFKCHTLQTLQEAQKCFKNGITETTKKFKEISRVVNSCFLRQQDFCLQSLFEHWGREKNQSYVKRFSPGGFTRTGMSQNTSKCLLRRLQPSAYTHPDPRLAKEF